MTRIRYDATLFNEKVTHTTIDTELLSCPFCGGEDIGFWTLEDTVPDRGYGLAVGCNSCGGAVLSGLPIEKSEADYYASAAMWNRRHVKGLTDA